MKLAISSILFLTVVSIVPAQTLYGIGRGYGNITSKLFRIDDYRTNPKAVVLGDTKQILMDIAIHPGDGRMFAISGSALYELNPKTAAAKSIGSLGTFNQEGLEFDISGRLWTWGSGMFGQLRTVDTATGKATLFGRTGFGAGGDLAFDLDGTVWGLTGQELVTLAVDNGGKNQLVHNLRRSRWGGLEVDVDGTLIGLRTDSSVTTWCQLVEIDKVKGTQISRTVAGSTWLDAGGLALDRTPGVQVSGPGGKHIRTIWIPSKTSPYRGVLKFQLEAYLAGKPHIAFLGVGRNPTNIPFAGIDLLVQPDYVAAVVFDALGQLTQAVDAGSLSASAVLGQIVALIKGSNYASQLVTLRNK